MRILLSLLVLCTFTLSARAAEDFCKGKETCRKGYVPMLKSGTYYAKGTGRTCEEAKDNSQSVFAHEYGDMSCGLISGPYVWDCTKLGKNNYIAWTKCNPDSGPGRSTRPRCGMIGGIIVC